MKLTCIIAANYKKNLQDMQFTCNVTLRRFRANIVAVEKEYVLHILSVCL